MYESTVTADLIGKMVVAQQQNRSHHHVFFSILGEKHGGICERFFVLLFLLFSGKIQVKYANTNCQQQKDVG